MAEKLSAGLKKIEGHGINGVHICLHNFHSSFFCFSWLRILDYHQENMNVSFRRDKSFQHSLKQHFSMKKFKIFSNFLRFLSSSVVFLHAIKYSTKCKTTSFHFLTLHKEEIPKHTLWLPTRIKVLNGKIWGLTGLKDLMQHIDSGINILTQK